MSSSLTEDLPDLPYARQLKEGFPWLRFGHELETVFRRARLEESLGYIRANLLLAIAIAIALSAMDALVLGRALDRIPGTIDVALTVPLLVIVLAASFSPNRQKIYAPLAVIAFTACGLSQVAIQVVASLGGAQFLFPAMIVTAMYVYFLAGLDFYAALAVNFLVLVAYLAAGDLTALPATQFG